MALGYKSLANNQRATAIGPDSRATGSNALAAGPGARATATNSLAVGARASADFYQSTALGYEAQTKRAYEVSVGSSRSIYRMPGLTGTSGSGFVGSRYQNSGTKKLVTTDDQGTLGTSSYSVNDLVDSVGAVGALSASLSAIPQTTLLPDENLRCGIGTGGYGNQWAGSLGCAVKLKKRMFLNAGLASTPTPTIGGSVMGRVGFSIGFGGGSSSDQQHQQLSRLPNMSPTSTSMLMDAGMDVPLLDAKEEAPEVTAYRSEASPVVSSIEATQMTPKSETFVAASTSEDSISAMRQRLSELEEEIDRLRSRDVDDSDASDQRIAELERLLQEKRDSEASLLSMLEEFQKRLDQQRLLIDQLMKRVDVPQAMN